MSTESRSLAELQREMAAAVMMPLTEDEEMCASTPDGREMSQVAASFIAPNSRLSAFERLEIYNRQYWFRVLGGLGEDFPALRAVVGDRAFHKICVAYLVDHPSRSFGLRNLGAKLPDWLAAHADCAGRRRRLALDIARIEWAYVEAFDSAERSPLTREQVATLDGSSRLALQPHLQLVALDYAADEVVLHLHQRQKRDTSEASVREEEPAAPPAKLPFLRHRPVWLGVHRVDLSVYYRRLQREEFRTLAALRNGLPLAEALDAGFRNSPVSAARRPGQVRAWFSTWAELGWVCAPDLEPLVSH